nr:acyltransferase [uncultured Methanoregula sp.]
MKKNKGKLDVSSQIGKLPPAIPQIDVLKAFAIIAVVLLHALPFAFFLSIGSPYYLWQAVPVFIVIAGFTGAYAYKRYGSATLKQCYDPSLIIRRFKRLLIPFLLCYIIEIILLYIFNQISLDPASLILSLLTGGYGWGAYFIPIMLQSIIIVPLLYLLSRRNPDQMVIIALILTIVFDIIVFLIGWNNNQTSSIYFRYLFAGALGVWIVTSEKRNKIWLIVGGIISLVYITLSCYTPLFSAFPDYSGYTGILQAPAFMWAAILVLFGLAYLPENTDSGIFNTLSEIGKASWHIFLAQLLYYFLPSAYVYAFLVAPLASGNEILQDGLIILCNIIICVGVGYGWYFIEKKILQKSRKAVS